MKSNQTINHIISLIFKASRLIHEQLRKERKHPDLFSGLRLEALRYIAEKKNPLMKEVADYFCITPPSATSLINPLVKSGALRRVYDKDDRRVVRLFITSKGRKELKRGLSEVDNNMRKILTQLNTDEQKNLIKILEKLSKIYENYN